MPGQRRSYPKSFKAQVVEECTQPGASVAGVALSHGLNANLLDRFDLEFFGVTLVAHVLWSTKSGHWFRFIGPLIRHQLAFCIRCSCVAADGCSNPSDSAARPPQLGLGWHSRVPASTPFSSF